MTSVRVALPAHLRMLAGVQGEVRLGVDGAPTVAALLDALESRYPALRGTMRHQATGARRDFIRFFACGVDVSHASPEALLPDAVVSGADVFRVVGAIAGG